MSPARLIIGTFPQIAQTAKTCQSVGMRCLTLLTTAFSKKLENLEANVTPYFMHYDFARVHQTLRVTPAMAAGIADLVWSLEEIVNLLF
jgi:hypothetical protein